MVVVGLVQVLVVSLCIASCAGAVCTWQIQRMSGSVCQGTSCTVCHVAAMPTLWVSIAAYNATHPKLQVRLEAGVSFDFVLLMPCQ